MKVIGFTGHRDKTLNSKQWRDILDFVTSTVPVCQLWIHGGAVGFDNQVEDMAIKHGYASQALFPDYSKYPRKQAPLMRNINIVTLCNLLIACYDGRRNGGTYFTINEARKRNMQVIVYNPDGEVTP